MTLKKKVNKTLHTSTIVEGLTKHPSTMTMIKAQADLFNPERFAWRERLCFSLIEWAKTDEALDMTQFSMDYGIARDTLREWTHKYPDIKRTYDEAKLYVGTRRRVGNIKRYYSDSVFKDMYKYDPDWKEVDAYQAALKSDDTAPKSITFLVKQAPNSDEVPLLEKKDENDTKLL